MAKSKGRLLAELLASDGKVKESKSALDIAGGKLSPSDIPTLPNSKLENSSISIAGHSTSLGGSVTLNTGDITEHTNYKYYTEGRARSAISASGDLSYNSSTGVISFSATASPVISVNSATGSVVLDTGDIAENGNLYHTTARARAAISATGSLSYNSTTGVISFTMPAQNTSNITEGSNKYYTDARVGSYLSTNGYATQSTIVGAITDSAPATLDTLNELAAALGDDANFSTTVTNSIATKLPLAGGTLTGAITAPTLYLNNTNTRLHEGSGNALRITTSTGYIDIGSKNSGWIHFEGNLPYYFNQALSMDGDLKPYNTSGARNLGTTSNVWNHVYAKGYFIDSTEVIDSSRNLTNIGTISATGGNSTNWNTAYGWGNHASAGYITDGNTNWNNSYGFITASDSSITSKLPLAGGTVTGSITVRDNITVGNYSTTDTGSLLLTGSTANKQAVLKCTNGNLHMDGNAGNAMYLNYYTGSGIYFGTGAGGVAAVMGSDGDLWKGSADNTGNKYWHAGNDGSGSGLDADLLDGFNASSSATASTVAVRDSAKDLKARLFRSEYTSTNSTTNYIMTQVATGTGDNYIRPSTPAQIRAGLGIEAGATADQSAAEILTAIKTVDGSGSGLDADTLDGYQKSDINPAHSHYRWTGISASSTQARRFVIMRLYGCPAHWDSNWQDIHFKVWSESYEATNLKYQLTGDYGGAGTQANMFQLRLKDAGGSSEHSRFRLVLGTPVDAGWDHSGQNTYYVDVYAEASHYMNFTVAADFYSAGFNVNTLPTSGGATSVVYSSPTVSNITTFNEAKEHSYFANHKIWNDGNHGSASGLDADLLDGQHGSYYYAASNPNGYTNDQTAAEILTAIKTVDGSGSGLDADTVDGVQASRIVYGDNATATNSISGAALNPSGHLKSGFYRVASSNSTIPNATSVNFVLHTSYNAEGNTAGFDLAANDSTTSKFYLRPATGGGRGAWQTIWTSSSDGAGSGLDADLLDGQHGSHYLNYNNLTNKPSIPSLSGYATESYVGTQISNLVDSSPAALNTLNELAAAIGDDANFSTTVTNNIATKLPKAGGTMTGNLIIDYSGNATNDAGIYIANDNSDWGIYVNKDGTGTYGIKIAADGEYPFQITNSSGTEKFRVNNSGNVILAGTVDGRDVSADGTKLDTIATSANNYSFPYTVSASESNSTVVQRHPSGYIYANYYNGSGTFSTSGNASGMGLFTGTNGSDTFGRSYTAAAARTLLNVENGATADQTAAEILTAIKTVDGSGSGLDADLLDGMNATDSRAGNTIVKRQANGYMQAVYVNTTDDASSTSLGWLYGQRSNSDGYHRRFTAASVRDWGGFFTTANDGSGSGLDADTVDGKHKDFLMHYKGAVSGNWDTIFSQTDGHMGVYQVTNISNTDSNYPSGAYTYGGVMSWQLDDSTFKLYAPHTGQLHYQTGWNNDEYSGWRKIWDTGNDGSGSGLDADTVDGYHVGNSSNNTANSLVITEGNGYISSNYFYTSSNNNGTTAIARIYASQDGYIRYYTPTNFRTNLGLWWSGNDGSGSGLDADLLDSVEGSNHIRKLAAGTAANVDSYTDNGFRAISYTGFSKHLLSFNAGGSTGTMQQEFDYTPGRGWRMRTKTDNSTWNSWAYVMLSSTNPGVLTGTKWTSSNDGSGSGLDADLLDGYNSATAATANTVVVRDSNAHITGNYILGSYFNASSGNNENPTIGQIWTQSTGDNYLRKSTPTHFASQMQNHFVRTDGSNPAFVKVPANYTGNLNSISNAGVYFTEGTGSISNNPFSSSGSFLQFGDAGGTDVRLQFYAKSSLDRIAFRNQWGNNNWGGWHEFWTTASDGSGSGLDADLLDGQQGSYYAPASHVHSYLPLAGGTITGNLNVNGTTTLGNGNADQTHINDTLYLGATDSGDSHFYFGENSSNWYGDHWYWDSGYEVERYSRYAGTDTLIEKHDTRYTYKVQTNRAYERLSHSTGYQIGSYNSVGGNSAKTNPIYTIGDSYRPSDTSVSGMYGIGYAHSNLWGTGSGKTTGWGQYVVEAGAYTQIFSVGGTWSLGEYNRNGNKVWDAGNDGAGSGLDADLLDGQHASAFLTAETLSSTNTVTVTGSKYWQAAGSATSPLGGGGGASLQAYAPNNGTAAYMAFHRSSQYAINWGLDTSNTMVLGGWSSSTTAARMSIGTNGLMVTAGQGNLWGASNDGSGSGLDADTVDGLNSSSFWRFDTANNGPLRFDTTEYDFTSTYNPSQQGVPNSIRLWNHYTQTNAPATYGQLLDLYGMSGHWRHQYHMLGTDLRFRYGTYPLATAGWSSWYTQWHSGNDGSGSGLDADLLDGYNAEETAVNNSIVKRDGGAMITAKKLYLNGGNYEGSIVFGAVDVWRCGIRQHDDGDAELRIWAKHVAGRVHIATGYDGQPASISRPTDGFVVNANNVGIGNFSGDDPTEKLHVKGNMKLTGNLIGNANSATFKANTVTSYGSWCTSGSRGGYDGIVFDNGGDAAIMFDGSGNGGAYRQSGGGWYYYFHVGNNCLGLNESTTSSSYGAYLTGAFYATGNITAYSDRRVKENIVQIDNALEKVNKLEGVYYNRIDDESKTKEIGFIAQDVNEVAPELVTYAEDVDQYGVKYGNTTALLVEAVKELTQQVKDLKQEIKEIKNVK